MSIPKSAFELYLPPTQDSRQKSVYDLKSTVDPFYHNCGKGPPAVDDLPDVIRALWAPFVLPITAPVFTTIDGVAKHLPHQGALVHTKPLGKQVCILDVDNRDFDEDGNIFSDRLPSGENLAS
ncbi:hypothetical protein VTH82DRAFT_3978 [Thermothelomyces myriococcoides]